MDRYDMFNAPQFLDFAALVENGGGYDDPETDKYFETHREEDDFFIPIETLQPTIQLLNESNCNTPPPAKEATPPAKQTTPPVDNMEDVSIEYYNTPNGKQSTSGNSMKNRSSNPSSTTTPAGKFGISSSSLTPSFHTPIGEEDNKENSSPSIHSFLSTAEKTLVASSRRTTSSVADGSVSQYFLRESLVAQLEKLNMVDDVDGHSECSPINTICHQSNNKEDERSLLNTTFNAQKNNSMNSKIHTPIIHNNPTVVDTPPESPQEVELYPTLNKATYMESNGQQYEDAVRPQSIYIAPSVGCEVVWNHEDEKPNGEEYLSEDFEINKSGTDDLDLDVNELHRSENCLSTLGTEEYEYEHKFEKSPVKNLRRVSSCGDIAFLVPKNRKAAAVYGFNPRAGITIPKTPDTARRRSMRSKLNKTSSNCSSKTSISSSVASSISSATTIGKTTHTYSSSTHLAQAKKYVSSNPYVSFAQSVANFQKNTPTRYRTAPRGTVLNKRSSSVDTHRRKPSPVSPRSPNLMTKQRARQTLSNSVANKPSEESKLIIKPQSTAQKIFKDPILALPKRIELKTTRPQPFKLTEPSRPKIMKQESTEWTFKARPAPMKILQGPIALKERPVIKTTAPKELHFASEDRIRERQQKRSAQSKEPSPTRQIFKPSKIPARRAPSPMRPIEHKTTTVKPFSFEQRDKDSQLRKEEKLKKVVADIQKPREFHANPLPTFTTKLPKRKPIEPTHVAPFRFKSDERGAMHQAAFRNKLEEEERMLREQQLFYANPANIIKKRAFEPAKSGRPLVEPLDIKLNSDIRAQEREKFDSDIKMRDQEIEKQRTEEEAKREQTERKLAVEMRQQLVHKAKPFVNKHVFEVKASDKPLVNPKSPHFAPLPSQRRGFATNTK